MSGSADVGDLIRSARAGDKESLGRLFGLYRNYLQLVARGGIDGTLGAKADPSDAVQETLLLAVRDFEKFRGKTEGELIAWLRRILSNSLAKLARRYRGTAARDVSRERCAIAGTVERSSAALCNLLASPSPSLSQAAVERERSVILADALAELAADQREVLILRFFRQLSWDEVAKEMSRSGDAARMLSARALRTLGPLVKEMLR
ncbi:MAG: sigma-70 family RNA polymerase sigma factor [Planctomycetota bacterium]|jgi:RNA polymerase sigma-70 factor (ECF subfamily)